MSIRSSHETRNLNSRKASVPTIAKGKPLDARGSEGDLTFRRTSEGLKLYIKANHKWHGIKVGESFDSLEKKINEIKSKVDTIKQFRLPSTYSVTGDFTLDVSGDIVLDADGGQVTIKDASQRHFLFDCDDTSLTIYDDTNAEDYFKILVAANGVTTLSTNDNDGAAGNLSLSADGSISLNSGASDGLVNIVNQGTVYAGFSVHHSVSELAFLENGGAGPDSFKIQVAANGATTLESEDGAGSSADIKLSADGDNWIFAHEQLKLDARNTSEESGGDIMLLKGGQQFGYLFAGDGAASDFVLYERGGSTTDDFFRIRVGEHGATSLDTFDTASGLGEGTAASLHLNIDGNITYEANSVVSYGTHTFYSAAYQYAQITGTATTSILNLYNPADTGDYFRITTGDHGATTISTLDNNPGAHAADLTLDPLGEVILTPDVEVKSDAPLKIKEAANAVADTAAYGQLWVKNETPCELYFTTDAGNDIQLTDGTSAAGGGGGGTNNHIIQITGRAYTRYDNWYYPQITYGAQYYNWNSSFNSSTLATSWADSYNPNWAMPVAMTLKSYHFFFNCSGHSENLELAVLKGTGVTYGSAGNYTLSNVGTTQAETISTSNILYKSEETGLSVSFAAGDILVPAARRVTSDTSTYRYVELSFSAVFEVD